MLWGSDRIAEVILIDDICDGKTTEETQMMLATWFCLLGRPTLLVGQPLLGDAAILISKRHSVKSGSNAAKEANLIGGIIRLDA